MQIEPLQFRMLHTNGLQIGGVLILSIMPLKSLTSSRYSCKLSNCTRMEKPPLEMLRPPKKRIDRRIGAVLQNADIDPHKQQHDANGKNGDKGDGLIESLNSADRTQVHLGQPQRERIIPDENIGFFF